MSFVISNAVEFIHVPKTGGCWVEFVCKPWIAMAPKAPPGGRHSTGGHTDLPSFAVARNPYDWFASVRGYTQMRWIIVEKGYPGWFQQCPYKKIGQLESLRVKDAKLEDILDEYLAKMPGEYTRATMEYYENADRLIDFNQLSEGLPDLLRALRVPNGNIIADRAAATKPLNSSKHKRVDVADVDGYQRKLWNADSGWYKHAWEKGVGVYDRH